MSLLKEMADRFAGEFSSVVILTSHQTEEGSTIAMRQCRGDWYAQLGMVEQFMIVRKNEILRDAMMEKEADQ